MVDSQILKVLEEKKPSLLNDLEKIRTCAEPLLNRVFRAFADDTDHTIAHSDEIIRMFDKIIPVELMKKLNEYEIYFLVASAYLHDIGMVDWENIKTDKEFIDYSIFCLKSMSKVDESEILAKYIKDHHNELSEKYVKSHYTDLKINNDIEAYFISKLCRGHKDNDENLKNSTLYPYNKPYVNKSINMPLLCGFLRIADDLDTTHRRTPLLIWNTGKPRDKINIGKWLHFLIIDGVTMDVEDPSRILINASYRQSLNLEKLEKYEWYKICASLEGLQEEIQEKMDNLHLHLHGYKEFAKSIPKVVRVIMEDKNIKKYINENFPEIKDYDDLYVENKIKILTGRK